MDRLLTIYNADKLLFNGETFIFDPCYIDEIHDQWIEKIELVEGNYIIKCDYDGIITVILENHNENHKLSEESWHISIDSGSYCIMSSEKRAILTHNKNIHNKWYNKFCFFTNKQLNKRMREDHDNYYYIDDNILYINTLGGDGRIFFKLIQDEEKRNIGIKFNNDNFSPGFEFNYIEDEIMEV